MKRAGRYWVPDHETLQIEALSKGPWQIDHLYAALQHVAGRTLAVDVGAHVGTWTLALAEAGFRTVEAFEPAPDTFECLRENVKEWREANPDRGNTVSLTNCALGETTTFMGMKEDGKYAGGNTGGRYLKGEGKVFVRPLDVYNLQELDFLKLDVEGFELFVLKGARSTLLRCRPVVVIEDKY
ncbi:MAG: FkbM family methyltransferase, partial [Bradyrhizobium sp.]|nr:FkbM family methyltransferase [Bradyrhizobium sp.]